MKRPVLRPSRVDSRSGTASFLLFLLWPLRPEVLLATGHVFLRTRKTTLMGGKTQVKIRGKVCPYS